MKKIIGVLCVGILSVVMLGGYKSSNKSLNEISNLQSEIVRTKRELVNFNTKIDKLEKALANKTEELMNSNQKIRKLNKEINNLNKEIKNLQTIIADPSEIFIGSMDLDSKTEKFLYGTWEVEKLLGFAISYNDASEYPTGQNIIGDEIIINKDLFSSKGLKKYKIYQCKFYNPLYQIKTICSGSENFERVFKIGILDLNKMDIVKRIEIYESNEGRSMLGSFFVVNNDRLILMLEATCFELKKLNK